MNKDKRNRIIITVLSIPLILIFIMFGPPYYESLGMIGKRVFMAVSSGVILLLLYYVIGERILLLLFYAIGERITKGWVNRMAKYNCPECGGNAPESGGVYYKSYSPEENDEVSFLFPVYMCAECELEFVINGCRIVDGELVWQDKNVKREDYPHEDSW